VVVTGAAGFIGSRLAHLLLDNGHEVLGIDGFTDSYDTSEKLVRATRLVRRPGFTLLSGHLAELPLDRHLRGSEIVYHLAGRAGVRASFALESRYRYDNVESTTAVLDASRRAGTVRRVVYASSSSVYGNACLPFTEDGPAAPVSPYGQSKLDAETICLAASGMDIETVALRYFTVYGPGQRPDMGLRLFAEAAWARLPISIFGDGQQSRDFTFVDDIAMATAHAGFAPAAGYAINVGGGSRVSLLEVLEILAEAVGHPLQVNMEPSARGDVLHTEADLSRAEKLLGFKASTTFFDGYRAEIEWLRPVEGGRMRRTA
jgi:nucleoside-diphosphate-sugar epimerase